MASQRGQDHGWYIDPFAKRVGKGTRENPGHPRQCRAKNKYGEQCGRQALRGKQYCQFHGGRFPLVRFKVGQRYGKYVSKALGKMIAEMAAPPTEILDLTEELNISRLMLGESLTLATPCFDKGHKDHKKTDDTTRALALSTLRCSLDHVTRMISVMAKVEALTKDKIPVSHLSYFMTKVMEIVDSRVDDKTAKKIGKEVAAIQMPAKDLETHMTLELD